jgi:hypothetical protein
VATRHTVEWKAGQIDASEMMRETIDHLNEVTEVRSRGPLRATGRLFSRPDVESVKKSGPAWRVRSAQSGSAPRNAPHTQAAQRKRPSPLCLAMTRV